MTELHFHRCIHALFKNFHHIFQTVLGLYQLAQECCSLQEPALRTNQDFVQTLPLPDEFAKFFSLFLWLCINVLHSTGECCESVPLDHTGSYISISINITKILAHVVQVDTFIISL